MRGYRYPSFQQDKLKEKSIKIGGRVEQILGQTAATGVRDVASKFLSLQARGLAAVTGEKGPTLHSGIRTIIADKA